MRCDERVGRQVGIGLQVRDGAALGQPQVEEALLVLEAALAKQVELRVLAMVRLLPQALDLAQLQRRQVVALQEPDEVRRADDDAAVRVSLHGAWIPLFARMALGLAGILHAAAILRTGGPDHAQGQDGEAGARERDGDDEHQRGGHDTEEDGRGCHGGGEGLSMTLHGSTVAPVRATLDGTSSRALRAGTTPARRADPSYDATMRTGACVILAACLVAACGGASRSAASGPPTPSGAEGPSTPASSPSGAPTASPTVAQTPRAEAPTPGPTLAGPLALASSAFGDGGAIPSRYTCDGRDLSPPLTWTNVPEGTASFLLTMRDIDADGFLHWMAWNIPATTTGLEAGASGDLPGDAGEGRSDFTGSRRGYRGPCPPSGTHDYVLTLYALPIVLADAATTPPARLEGAAGEIALGLAALHGTYRH